MSRQQTDTFLIECSRNAQVDQGDHVEGRNSRWVNNLAQSIMLLPGDRINVESAMVQSGIGEGLIELTGDKDTTGSMDFAYYLTNDWCFSAPLPLYGSLVHSDHQPSKYTSSGTVPDPNEPQGDLLPTNRYMENYGELYFSSTSLNTPYEKVHLTNVNASKNIGPNFERLYAGIDYYGGFYANGQTETQKGVDGLDTQFAYLWDLKQSTVNFEIPTGFHTPDNIAQLMTDQMHKLSGSCESGATFDDWVPPIIYRHEEVQGVDEYSVHMNYNPTDPKG